MRVTVPFPYRPRERAYGDLDDESVREIIRAAPTQLVPLSILHALQHTVDEDRVSQYERDPETRSSGGSPIVVERGGRYFIRNGHHRATSAVRRGERAIRARVAHLGAQEPIPFRAKGHAGELLLIEPSAMQATYRQREVEDVAELVDGVAVLCIDGPLESKAGGSWWSYFDDYESILARFQCAIDSDETRSVLLKIDSGGGSAAGLNECVDKMLRLKKSSGKRVCAYVDEGAYSAAFALACVADEIYLPRAGGVGSIGVIVQLLDWTAANDKDGLRYEVVTSGARKGDFNPNVPLSGAAISRAQRRVDGLAKIYFKLVKDTRGIEAQKLEADTFYGKDAVKRGLADGVMSLDQVMSGMTGLAKMAPALDRTSKARSISMAHGTERHRMSNLIALTAKVKAATEALAKASRKTRESAEATLALAESALARELAKEQAKVTKDKKTITTVHESESESSSSSSKSSSSSESEAASESMSESEAYSESEHHDDDRALAAKAREITGKKTTREALGALEAMRDIAAAGPKAARQLAKLSQERADRKVEDLITAGKASHKITPGNEAKARKIAAKHGYKALAAFVEAAMPAIDSREVVEAEDDGNGIVVTAEQRKIWTKMGYEEKEFPKLAQAMQKEAERLTKPLLAARNGGN